MKNLISRKFGTKILAITLIASLTAFWGCQQPSDEDVDLDSLSLKNGLTEQPIQDICTSVCLVAGQYMYVGSVNVGMYGDDLQIQYEITEPGIYLLEAHADIFDSLDEFKDLKKSNNGGATPGKFTYKATWKSSEMKTTYTFTIPASYFEEVGIEDDCFFIATHAKLSNGETAWGGLCEESDKGVSLDDTYEFGNNWSTYFEFCKEECTTEIDFTYAWEDLNKDWVNGITGNDGDYNDLVIKSNVIKSPDELQIVLHAVARGASYNHAFKIMVPKAGIVGGMAGIDGAASITENGNYYSLTIFASTKTALPEEGYSPYQFAANTVKTDPNCTPNTTVVVTIAIDENFPFDSNMPYYPFITVHPGHPLAYDLNVYSLAEYSGLESGDSWIGENGEIYPNGIIIPSDWQWPYEKTYIGTAYTSFTSITATFSDNWYETPPVPGTVFPSCD